MGAPLTIEAANIGMADSLILMVMALVVFGPRKLPQLGRQIGKLMYEFRKASNDFKFQMEEEFRSAEEAERRKKEEAERQQQLALHPAATAETPASTVSSSTSSYGGYIQQEQANAPYPSGAPAPAEAPAATESIAETPAAAAGQVPDQEKTEPTAHHG
jgi:sec-independent protein translocase protein TatB